MAEFCIRIANPGSEACRPNGQFAASAVPTRKKATPVSVKSGGAAKARCARERSRGRSDRDMTVKLMRGAGGDKCSCKKYCEARQEAIGCFGCAHKVLSG